MTNSAVPVRSTRIRTLAVIGALALALGLVPAQAAVADVTTGTISGVVTTEGTGAPVSGAWVYVQSGPNGDGVTTAADGSFSFSFLPFGTYSIQVSAPDHIFYFNGGYEITEQAPDLVTDVVIIPIPTGDSTVSGLVTNDVTGLGVEGISVQISTVDFSWFDFATTDASGGYSFTDLAPGAYTVMVSLFAFPVPLPYGYEPPVTVTVGDEPAVVDFALTPYASGTSVLTGSITDAQTGLPIGPATVSISGLSVTYSGGTTASSGAYSIGELAAGTYSVGVWATGYLAANAVVVISDASTATWDAALIRLDAVVQGRVTDPSGNGVPDFWVSVSGPTIGAGMTDADGYYTITNLAPGDYVMWVGGPGTPWSPQELSITAIADSAVTLDVQFVARTTSAIWGAVFDQHHNGIQFICVHLIDVATGDVVESTESWVDAMFEFQEVADGTYTVLLEDCAVSRPRIFGSTYLGGGTTLDEAETFTIDGPANDLQLDDTFLAGPPTGWVALVVTDSVTGDPIAPGVHGYLAFDSVSYPFTDWTESGYLQIRDLPYGEYDFHVVAPGYSGQLIESVVIDATTPEHTIEIELTPVTDSHDQDRATTSTVAATDTDTASTSTTARAAAIRRSIPLTADSRRAVRMSP